ncbi:chemotaxis-specific protein-glutamate methyltransferase CheB [Mariprofundus sp. KV]|uniref:chemotaxis-specific protein-glutamate methyltransferase CheB n=1 Tax=Mariprofundus sp. KV TaxID=2608715 RepID=UPI0015A45DF3|nr:chemotaxis-specific protein-glutamate methyltransferase CheB [Mariprofundus sp. KV]NWF37099.1 chemotaxis-specific protein-glutamate methyltransferase CheB [Mariprofundus sp. KV]
MIKILIVDDSAVYRLLLKKALNGVSDIEVVGVASDGQEAIELIPSLKPDVLTLDLNMPRMNGMETLAVLSVKYPHVKVVVVAAATYKDAESAVSILEAGAFDVVVKPKANDPTPMRTLSDELIPKLQAAVQKKTSLQKSVSAQTTPVVKAPIVQRSSNGYQPDIVAIGSSTGGPAALSEVVKGLPADCPVPIVIVQHMPKLFIESLCSRLDSLTSLNCCVAEDGMGLHAGSVYFAPGESHLDVVRAAGEKLKARLHDGPPEHHCRPAVDVTLRSLHALAPSVSTLVVILTGMGADGAKGAKLLADANARVIAQDEATSVVWGMPGQTVKLGAANEVLALRDIASAIKRYVAGRLK